MADAGIQDILMTFNVVGSHKLKRLAALAQRTDISVDLSPNYAPVVSRLCASLLPCWAGCAMAMGA